MIYFITTFMLSLNQNTIMYQYSTYYNISIITKVEYHVSILFKYFNNTLYYLSFFFFQEEDGIRDGHVTGVQTCALPIYQVKRHIHTVWLEFSEEEKHVYQSLENMSSTLKPLIKLTLLRELCSSREACFLSLENILADQQATEIENIRSAIAQLPHHVKAQKIVELINQIGDEKVIIFTEYRATQYYLQWYLQEHGISSVPFRGGFKSGKKDWMRQLFRDHAQVLIATEAGGEGINLQFCNHLINYDLPWNPMRLEQRIGRVHRYGQENNIQIYNFAIHETIEEHIMTLLYEKINLFEQVIGDLDEILAELQIDNL